MADSLRKALTELVRKAELEENTDLLREGIRVRSDVNSGHQTFHAASNLA